MLALDRRFRLLHFFSAFSFSFSGLQLGSTCATLHMLNQLIASCLFIFGPSSVALMLAQNVLDRRDSSTAQIKESGSGLGLRWGRGRNNSGLGVDSGLRRSRLEVPRGRSRLGRGIGSGG